MRKQFCPECGNPSLQRASITMDSSGQRQYYLIGRYRPKPRVIISRWTIALFKVVSIKLSAITTVASWWKTRKQSNSCRRSTKTTESTDQESSNETKRTRWWLSSKFIAVCCARYLQSISVAWNQTDKAMIHLRNLLWNFLAVFCCACQLFP